MSCLEMAQWMLQFSLHLFFISLHKLCPFQSSQLSLFYSHPDPCILLNSQVYPSFKALHKVCHLVCDWKGRGAGETNFGAESPGSSLDAASDEPRELRQGAQPVTASVSSFLKHLLHRAAILKLRSTAP